MNTSQDRPKSYLYKKVEENEKRLVKIEGIQDKLSKCPMLNNNFVEEEMMVDVKQLKETGGLKMIVDSGASLSIV